MLETEIASLISRLLASYLFPISVTNLRSCTELIHAFGVAKWAIAVLVAFVGHGKLASRQCAAQDTANYAGGGFDPYATPSTSSDFVGMPLASPFTVPLASGNWCFDLFPDGLIYRPYLAGPKESRTGIQFYDTDDGWQFDSSIGGQWGLLRIGTQDSAFPQGWQLDFEASAQFRHSDFASQNVLTNDIRFGLPLSFSRNNHQTKFSLYFLRSNASSDFWDAIGSVRSDEFFERKALVLGHSIYLSDRFRVYGEAGYAFSSRVSDQWELQFGAECAPVRPTGILGAPFLAANALLREELDFGGTFNLQAGWAWRKKSGRLFRLGVHYANGASNHFAIHDQYEHQFGFGIWHDF